MPFTLPVMPTQQKIFALIVSMLVIAFIINMVRQRRLREEYSVLWLATSVVMLVLILKYQWLVLLTYLIGATTTTTTLFLFALIFLILLAVQFCIKISQLTNQVKNLSQENALIKLEIDNLVLTTSDTYNKMLVTERDSAKED